MQFINKSKTSKPICACAKGNVIIAKLHSIIIIEHVVHREQNLTEDKMKMVREYPHMHQNRIRFAFEPIY